MEGNGTRRRSPRVQMVVDKVLQAKEAMRGKVLSPESRRAYVADLLVPEWRVLSQEERQELVQIMVSLSSFNLTI